MIKAESIFSKSVLAGISVGICSYLSLLCSSNIIGSIVFSLGFLSCTVLNLNLFTHKAGCSVNSVSYRRLSLVLLLNLLGALLIGILVSLIDESCVEAANKIISTRLESSIPNLILLSTTTGFLMSIAVELKNNKPSEFFSNLVVLLVCSAIVYIICIPHCIADMFFYSVSSISKDHLSQAILRLLVAIIFNFIGCNLFNLIVHRSLITHSGK